MLAESARLARETGAYWQTHLSEDVNELAEVARLFPDAVDYTDVYDRAGLRPGAILAHAVHLSDREIGRLAESGAAIAHCPASNLFLASGAMPLGRYLQAGLIVGLGSDVAAGPDVSLFGVMRAGAYTQNGLHSLGMAAHPAMPPSEWLRLADAGRCAGLGIEDRIGSVEASKEADLIVVDPATTLPLGDDGNPDQHDGPDEILSRLIYRISRTPCAAPGSADACSPPERPGDRLPYAPMARILPGPGQRRRPVVAVQITSLDWSGVDGGGSSCWWP